MKAMLKREIKRWDLVLLVINGIIGAGIFGLPSKIFALTGVYSLVALIVCAIVIFVFILTFAEVGSRFDKTGGPYLYTFSSFGPYPAYLLGWVMLVSRLAAYAALMNLFVIYLGFFYEDFNDPWPRAVAIVVFTSILTSINYKGVKNSAIFSNYLAVIKMSTLALFIGVGLFFIDTSKIQFGASTFEFGDFSSSILLLVFAFTGFEATVVNTGEIKDPNKNIPFALIISLVVIATLYILIQFVCIGTLSDLGNSEKPIADAARIYMGPVGASLISLGALISIGGTLHAIMLIGSRLPYALSQEGQFPKLFSYLHPVHLTPVKSLIAFSIISILISVTGSFTYALSISVISKIIIFVSVAAALLKLRTKLPDSPEYFKLKYGKAVAIIALLISIWLLASTKWLEMRDFSITVFIGIISYYLLTKYRKN